MEDGSDGGKPSERAAAAAVPIAPTCSRLFAPLFSNTDPQSKVSRSRLGINLTEAAGSVFKRGSQETAACSSAQLMGGGGQEVGSDVGSSRDLVTRP